MPSAKNLLLATYESLDNHKTVYFSPNINRVAKSKERPQERMCAFAAKSLVIICDGYPLEIRQWVSILPVVTGYACGGYEMPKTIPTCTFQVGA